MSSPLPNDYRRRRDDGSDLPDVVDLDEGEVGGGEPLEEETDPETGNTIVYLDAARKPRSSARDFYANLADGMPQERKDEIVQTLLERIEVDKKSREKRDKQYEEGLRRTGLGDDAPGGASFSGASKVVHPVMAEACVDFSAAEMRELFPPNGPVRADIIGKSDPEKVERAKRKTRHMNLQITREIEEFRAEMEQMTTQLPMGGSQYIKPFYSEELGRPSLEFVPIDDVYIPYSSSYFYTSLRITHVQHLTTDEIGERIDSGFYLDFEYNGPSQLPDESRAKGANDKIEGMETPERNDDGLRDVYETSALWRLEREDDPLARGKRAPYLISIDKDTQTLLGIYRNWEADDRRRTRLDFLIDFQYIPWRGAVGIGLPQLIGSLSGAATGALRALLDSALINTIPTLVKAKGRPGGMSDSVSATQVNEIDVPQGKTLRESLQQMDFPEPSVVLYQLLGFLVSAAKGVVTTAEEKIEDANSQMPVGTTMALIEQGSKVASSIHSRMHAAQARVLRSIHRFNRIYLDDEDVLRRYGEQIVKRADYEGPVDVIPVSDPLIFSETQRMAQAQAAASRSDAHPELYKPAKVERMLLDRLRITDADAILADFYEAENTDAVDENVAMSNGRPVKAFPEQDHLAHLTTHLSYFTDPVFGASPLIAAVAVTGLIGHLREHLSLYYRYIAFQNVGAECDLDLEDESLRKSPDELRELDRAFAFVSALVHSMKPEQAPREITSILPALGTIMQAAQQGMQAMAPIMDAMGPKDPKAEAAKAETERKAKADEMKAMGDKEQRQIEGQKVGLEGKAQEIEAGAITEEQRRLAEKDAADIELRKEGVDQKREAAEEATDAKLIVNEQDNKTALVIAGMDHNADEKSKVSTGSGINPNP